MKRNRIKTLAACKLILAGITLLLITSCWGTSRSKNNEERIITVTMEPQRYFTEAIAGDKFKVVSMVPKGSSPETYDPTPQQLVALSESDAYFRIGYIGFEVMWMDRLMDNAPHTQVFDTSEGIDLIYESQHQHGDHFHYGGVEPHVWNSTINARIIAQNTFKALSSLDKENEAYYLERYDSLMQHIEEVEQKIARILSSGADHGFMIYHPALSYFARDYGLIQVSIEEDGKEPSPAHLKQLIDICNEEDINVIFIQPEFDQRNAQLIARETNTKIVPINPLAYEWDEEMIRVAESLAGNS